MSVDVAFRGVTDSCKIHTAYNGSRTDYSCDAINLRGIAGCARDFANDGTPFRYHAPKMVAAVALPARASQLRKWRTFIDRAHSKFVITHNSRSKYFQATRNYPFSYNHKNRRCNLIKYDDSPYTVCSKKARV